MKYPEISKLMKKQRKMKEATIYDLAEMVKVTASYLSQVENGNKLPSKPVLMKLTHWLDVHTDNNFAENFLSAYANYKNIDIEDFIEGFKEWRKLYLEHLMKPLNDFSDDITNNRIEAKKNTFEVERIDKPYFDLNWLLTQKDFEVLYHRDYDIQNTMERGDIETTDKLLYNRLNDDDIKTIREIIEAYISNKYRKFPDRKK